MEVLDSSVPLCPLGELVSLRAGATTGTAYELAPLVEEAGNGPRLITTGLIDRYECTWGSRKCRYLKRTYLQPTWPCPSTGSVQRAAVAQHRPKILIAGLSKVLEAVADPQGQLAGVVSTWVAAPVHGQEQDLWLWEALLNSPVLSLIYAIRYRGKELSGGNITIGKRELAVLPVPEDIGTLQPGTVPPLDNLNAVFSMDPVTRAHRQRLAATATRAVQRRGWSALDTDRDLLAAAAVARLYGLSKQTHQKIQSWFESRCPLSQP